MVPILLRRDDPIQAQPLITIANARDLADIFAAAIVDASALATNIAAMVRAACTRSKGIPAPPPVLSAATATPAPSAPSGAAAPGSPGPAQLPPPHLPIVDVDQDLAGAPVAYEPVGAHSPSLASRDVQESGVHPPGTTRLGSVPRPMDSAQPTYTPIHSPIHRQRPAHPA